MNGRFSKTTVSRVLNGGRPSWSFTRCFLGECDVSDSAIMEVWRPKWTDLHNTLRPLAPPDGDRPICGVWATNASRHADYHRQRGDLSTYEQRC